MKQSLRLALLSSAVIGFLASCGGGNAPTTTTTTDTHNHADSSHSHATTTPAASTVTKDFAVDASTSLIKWIGTKVGGKHEGTIKIKSGTVKVANGKLSGGSFVLDMPSITVTDLTGEDKAKLEGHLKTADFFQTDKFAEGKFEITKVDGDKIEGNLTLKDKTNPISFTSVTTVTDTEFKSESPAFMINRQQWGINYQSKMKDAPISDDMSIQIRLAAK